jgi:hypothetical protein
VREAGRAGDRERRAELLALLGDPTMAALNDELLKEYVKAFEQLGKITTERCKAGQGPEQAIRMLALMRQAQLQSLPIPEDAYSIADACLRFELTYTTTIDDHTLYDPEIRQQLSVTNLEIRPLSLTAPWVKPIALGSFQTLAKNHEVGHCTYTPTLVEPTSPFKVIGVDLDLAEAKPRPERIWLDVDPGDVAATVDWACAPDGGSGTLPPTGYFRREFTYLYADQGYWTDAPRQQLFRITGWQRVPGSGWAIERRYERSKLGPPPSDSTGQKVTETTGFFLRQAPPPPPPP